MHAALPIILAALAAIFRAFSALCLCEPRPPRGEMQAVPCGARSDAAEQPASSSQPLDLLKSPLPGNIIPGYIFMLKYKRSLFSRTRLVIPQGNKRTGSTTPRRFRSGLDERASARRESNGLSLSVHIRGRNGPGRRASKPTH